MTGTARSRLSPNAIALIAIGGFVAIVAVIVVLTGGDDDTKRSTGATTAATAASSTTAVPQPTFPTRTPSLQAPDGWFTSEDGLVVAREEEDLTSDDPEGPRVTLDTDPPTEGPAAYEEAIAAGDGLDDSGLDTGSGITAADEPRTIQIDGHDAVAIAIADITDDLDLTVREYVTVRTGETASALFVLDAGGEEWDDALQAELEAILALT